MNTDCLARGMQYWVAATLLCLVMIVTGAGTVSAGPGGSCPKPRIGLVLSGGGARGAAHIGVIKVLEELDIPVHCVAGTSMGAVVGGLYASGLDSGEIEEVVKTIDWNDVLNDDPPRQERSFRRKRDDDLYLIKARPGFNHGELAFPSGLIQGQKIDLLFKSMTAGADGIHDFDDLKIPFRCLATDIVTGEAVVLGSGNLGRAMRASMSVPGAFAAVEIDDRLLVDGGIAGNLPIDVARSMGAEVIIAVDISTPLATREQLKGVPSITSQLIGILTQRNTKLQIQSLTEQDVLIVPDLGDISTADFKRAAEAVPIGIRAARAKRGELLKFSNPGMVVTARSDAPEKRSGPVPDVGFVRIDNHSRIGDDVLLAHLDIRAGDPLDINRIESGIGRIYGLDLFESVTYDIIKENGETGIQVDVREKSWGPDYLQFGAAFEGSSDSGTRFDLAMAYYKTGMNRLGGESRFAVQIGEAPGLFLDYFQYLDPESRFFVEPLIAFLQEPVSVYEGGRRIAEYETTRIQIELAVGRETGTWGEFRAGTRWYNGDADVRIGNFDLGAYDYDGGEVFVRVSHDKLDNRNFPAKGSLAVLEWTGSREALGADRDFDQFQSSALGAATWGRNTVFGAFKAGVTLDENAPPHKLFRGGGFMNLSGFGRNELTGQHQAVLAAGAYRRINEFDLVPAYIGMDLEMGNLWQDDSEISFGNTLFAATVFVGFDTFVGPVFIGYGHAEEGNGAVYFRIGEAFGSL